MSIPAPPSNPVAAASPAPWRLRLLGRIVLQDAAGAAQPLPAGAGTGLLARLALAPQREHPREELIELLWPGVGLAVGRNRLRQLLARLKPWLDPAGRPLIEAGRDCIRLAAGALTTDAGQFEQHMRRGEFERARALYAGELMPGIYDEWVLEERARLAALHERCEAALAARAEPPAASAPPGAPLPGPPLPEVARPALPHYASRTFGIDGAITELCALVRRERLVTLTGMGGAGKTRLATEVGHALLRDAPAAFELLLFVPLAACTTREQMLAALTAALQVPPGARGGVDGLLQALRGRRALLLLDNLEQLHHDAADIVLALVRGAPLLHLLLSSRRALGLAAEQVYALGALEPPPRPVAPAEAARNPALALFADRLRAAGGSIEFSPRNVALLSALVQALDGLPLAIELAAARGRHLGLQALHDEFVGRRGRRPDAMQASLDWSWRLLDAAQRRALARLSLFEAPFSAAAAAAVTGEDAAADRVVELAAQSLLQPRGAPADAAPRFALPALVREFAAAQLSAPERQAALQGLGNWLLAWARALGRVPPPAAVAPELAHVHALLAAAVALPDTAWALALQLRGHWDTDVMPLPVLAALEAALPALPPGPERAAAAELLAGQRFSSGFKAEALAHAEYALLEAGADAGARARSLVRRAWVHLAAARSLDGIGAALAADLDEALALAVAAGDREAQARALHQQAVVCDLRPGGAAAAEPLLAQSQQLWQDLGEWRKAAARLRNRAQCWSRLGRHAQALASLQACEAAAHDDGDWVGVIDAALSRSFVLARLRRWPECAAACRACVTTAWQRQHMHGLGYGLWSAAHVLARQRRPRDAARLMAFAAQFWVERFGPLGAEQQAGLRRLKRLVRVQSSAAQLEVWWIEGLSLTLPDAVRLALSEAG